MPSPTPMQPSVQGRKVLLIVSGGIAAYKVAYVGRSLALLGADVRVVMTRSATKFIGAQTFAGLTGNPVSTELFGGGPDVPHVELARGAELAIVAPATANLLAKMSAGIADDIASATLLAVRCPVLVAPAMHTEMWENAATRSNIETLVGRGVYVAGPTAGALSSGDEGQGRMVEPDEIVSEALGILGRSQELAGVRVLVTAGGTYEPIDPVRFIGNRSSGRMGVTIAAEAAGRGAKVTLVAGALSVPVPGGIEVIHAPTADEMRCAVVARSTESDVIVKAAAVADFKPEVVASSKIKKSSGPPEIRLVPTPDILRELGTDGSIRKAGSILVGFAAETEADPRGLAAYAQEKLTAKGADIIVANDVASSDSGFGVETNRAVIATAGGVRELGLVSKRDLARGLVDEIIRQRGSTPH